MSTLSIPPSSSPLVRLALIGDPQYADRDSWNGRQYREALTLHQQLIQRLNDEERLDFIVSLGDLGDGMHKNEVPLLLESYAQSRFPVRYVMGNHDRVQNSEEEVMALFGLDSLYYDFAVNGLRIVVINSLDESRFSPPDSQRRRNAAAFREANPGLILREWDGMLSQDGKAWLRTKLATAVAAQEDVIVLSHVPVWHLASGPNVAMWDRQDVLDILDGCPRLRAFFAGHYHPGGCAARKGVLHKTVRALCNATVPTACIANIYSDRIVLEAIGEEQPFVHHFRMAPVRVTGRAVPGAYVMANTGEITRANASGHFQLLLPAPGVYCLKAVADGMADAFAPMLSVPSEHAVTMDMQPEAGRRVIHGRCDGYRHLHIRDDGQPVRSFDLAGNPIGGMQPQQPIWHQKSENFWCKDEYAFSARGDVVINEVPWRPELRARGWYKGDFHAHIIHGENTYRGNLQFSAFIARAEHYDWIGLSGNFANDDYPADVLGLADFLSDDAFLLRLNQEYPKNYFGHVGNFGVEPIFQPFDPEILSNLEQAKATIVDRGGVAVPVHPLYHDVIREDPVSGRPFSWMTNKEVFLWLLCAPDMLPCLDLFYHDSDTPRAEAFWFMLLNRGYRIGCCATSDAAFDVGRSPGSRRGATYVKLAQLSEQAVVQAIKQGRTMVSWHGAALAFHIDDATCGDTIRPATGRHRVVIDAFYQPGTAVHIRLVRNGRVVSEHHECLPGQGPLHIEEDIDEHDNAWYLVIMTDDGCPRIKAAASPIYFRRPDFQPPPVLPYPKPFPDALRQRLKLLTLDELCSEAVFDELRDELAALSASNPQS